jgi:FKBP-type peptidyl-prolyl cis-trans isomerase SlyD
MLPGVEEAMAGKKAGDSFSVTLGPDKAYGEVQENAVQRVSVKHVLTSGKKKVKFKKGMRVQLNTQDGPRDVMIVKAGLKTLDVDLNHPFAGKTLKFDIDVVDVRDASEEEIAHGHAHGIGGHQH